MVENDEITGTMRGDGENDPVSEFIGKAKNSMKFKSIYWFFFSLLQSKLYCCSITTITIIRIFLCL